VAKTVSQLIVEYTDRIAQLKLLARDDIQAKNYCGSYQCEGRHKELVQVIKDLQQLESPRLETAVRHQQWCNALDYHDERKEGCNCGAAVNR
jgi:hypothetical protein